MKIVKRIFFPLFFSIVLFNVAKAQMMELPIQWKFKSGDSINWAQSTYNDSQWKLIKIGQVWQKAGYNHSGYSWYRTMITLPEKITKSADFKKCRYLTMSIGYIDDAAEAYINGKLVGEAGKLPPNFSWVWGKSYSFLIDENNFNLNEPNTIALRVYSPDSISGGMYDGPYFLKISKISDIIAMNTDISKNFFAEIKIKIRLTFKNKSFGPISGNTIIKVIDSKGKQLPLIFRKLF